MVPYYFITCVFPEFTFVCVSPPFRFILPLRQKDKDFGLFHLGGEFRVLLMFSKLCPVFSKLIS